MPQEIVTLECTEAKALGKPPSRYMTTRNKKSPRTPNRLEKKKYNPFLRRHTLHREHKYQPCSQKPQNVVPHFAAPTVPCHGVGSTSPWRQSITRTRIF